MHSARKPRRFSTWTSRSSLLSAAVTVRASYFDGRTSRVCAVEISVSGHDLVVSGEDIHLSVPFASIKVDERLGNAPRRLRFEDGTFCEIRDLEALDALLASANHQDGRIDRLQRRWQFVLFASVVCVAVVLAGYKYLLPWAAARVANHLPASASRRLSSHILRVLDRGILEPTQLTEQRQTQLTAEFKALRLPEGGTSGSELLFRKSPQLGANAFTLPDGEIVLLDELVDLIKDDKQLEAVLAHELGHVHGHHSLQLMLQSSAVGAFWSFYVGDVSQLLAAAPAAAIQARYSRDLERNADDYGAALLEANRMCPSLLADALEKLIKAHPDSSQQDYLSSHPPTDERMRRLRASTPQTKLCNP